MSLNEWRTSLEEWKAQASPKELASFEFWVNNVSLNGYLDRAGSEEIVWGDGDWVTNAGAFLIDHPVLGRPDERESR